MAPFKSVSLLFLRPLAQSRRLRNYYYYCVCFCWSFFCLSESLCAQKDNQFTISQRFLHGSVLATVAMSVCPLSVTPSHAGIVSKQRKLGSWNLHRRIAHCTLVLALKTSFRNSKGFSPTRALNEREWDRQKFAIFGQ